MDAPEKAEPIPALLPCPFCDNDGRLKEGHRDHWIVECVHCVATTGYYEARDGGKERAAAAWNRRADRASQEELIRELEAEIEEMTPKFVAYEYLVSPAGEEIALAENVRLLNRITALEAEASEGERRGLERAAEVAEAMPWYRHASPAHVQSNQPKDVAAAIRALIPEAPTQRELGSAAANQISTTEVGLQEAPAREGWQPISSVPRDGTKVLLFFPTYKDGPVDVYRFNNIGGDDFPWETSDGWGSDVGDEDGPTHWRPLPPPPSQDREPDSQRGAK